LFAQRANPTYIEKYVRGYYDYLYLLDEEGVVFSMGSDAHDISELVKIKPCREFIEKANVPDERIWRPECRPLVTGKA
jgi:histidinol phosphatase-like PHP family hydrolase